ncbi:hypothetical protein [aff. Roholtiella sp. LEGE 12411]|jgi:hypothetical protein|uniref:hypothetical protein n=1 Tax=aff. Roholtiella sp. LEGE 12411 TaxID=1828822 RepID=UPI0018803DC4|nr:hypothetical protein [aff. Roholtiella sp. LEGE 12411]MBE9034079.1 hypothetical protein [aff. Roholtiella sp. LEGE 12411]
MEPSEAQYLIINAFTTLDLLGNTFYDEESGNWYINSPSPILPIAMILQNGDIVPTTWDL